MSSLSDILSTMQAGVEAMQNLQQTQSKNVPDTTSGQLSADALVQPGFVRVLGVSVLDGSVIGFLHDAAALADADSSNQIYPISITKDFYPTNMVFKNGLVFKVGTGTKVAIFYSRF